MNFFRAALIFGILNVSCRNIENDLASTASVNDLSGFFHSGISTSEIFPMHHFLLDSEKLGPKLLSRCPLVNKEYLSLDITMSHWVIAAVIKSPFYAE